MARTIAPAALRNDNGKVTAWRAQYRDSENRKRQFGVFRTQATARRASEDHVAELNTGRQPLSGLTLDDWMELWPARVGRDPRTVTTHRARIEAYIYPYLPGGKDRAIAEIRREHIHDIQGALLTRGLSKMTVDGAIASLSAVLGYALREHRIETNPAVGARVDPADTRLQPVRARQERRWIPPDEAGHLLGLVSQQVAG